MKFLDEFRDLKLARAWANRIAERSEGRDFNFMEVCGTHTMSVHRYGIKDILPENPDFQGSQTPPYPGVYIVDSVQFPRWFQKSSFSLETV